ncbi:MAG: TonB-dependent receptor, partial [Bacteroidales bacterium]|nr:TonB-dependent receptor [Bacteroidales bacterium]
TTQGTVSDMNGAFTLASLPAGSLTISVSFVGYLTESHTVELAEGGSANIDFLLIEDLQQLSEVVVVGYGTAKKSDLTGAIGTIDTEELNKLSTINAAQAMQGRVAGVMVTANSGAPGDDVAVRIRGVSTVNNSDPLYVVDGFPTGSIAHINPSDIERMDILKDASATAIYGNRAAAGVIMITTKKGSEKKSTISFNVTHGIQSPNKIIDVLNAQEYAQAKYAAHDNAAIIRNQPTRLLSGSGSNLDSTFQAVLSDPSFLGTDWQNEVLQDGTVQNYELSINGGNERSTYNLSGSYNHEEGIVINTWAKRYVLRLAGTSKVNKMLTGNYSLSYRNMERVNPDRSIWGQSVLPNALVADPISSVMRPDTNYWGGVNISQGVNPVAAADRGKNNRTKIDQMVGNVGMDFEPLPGLVFSTKLGIDQYWQRDKNFIGLYNIGQKDLSTESSLSEAYVRDFGWNNSNYINYNKSIGKITFNVMAGQEWSAFKHERMTYTVYGVPESEALHYPHFLQYETNPSFNGDFSQTNRPYYETKLSSLFGRAFFSYNDRYLITATFRRDGASQLNEEYQWGFFPSASVGWNIKNEDFMKNIEVLSILKLRGGWGKTGNIGSLYDPYALYAVTTPGLDMVGEGDATLTGAIQTVNPNPTLQWETVNQINAGIDFGFFKNQLVGSLDVFDKTTTGMIVIIDPPYMAGALASAGNYGEMNSKGLELEASYRAKAGPVNLEIGGNITFLTKPMITRWAEPTPAGTVTKYNNITMTKDSSEMAAFWGYETDGLLSQEDIDNTYIVNDGDTAYTYEGPWYFYPGQLKLVDQNGDGQLDEEDKVNIGSANPDFFYGFYINVEAYGFDLSMFWQGVYGNELINGLNAWSLVPQEGDGNLRTTVLDAWTPENPDSEVPRLVQGNGIIQSYFNDYLIEDASYLRLKNIQLGYTLPQNISRYAGMERFRIYVSAENYLTITQYTGYDPEVGSIQYSNTLQRLDPLSQGIDQANYPIAKRILFGLNITF